MSAKSLQYITLAIAGVALIVAVVGCFMPTQDSDVTALIVDKDYSYVTVSVDADKSGELEIWCDGQFAGYVQYSSGNHVYRVQMNSFTSSEPITSLELRERTH